VHYYLRNDATGISRVTVTDTAGRAVRAIEGGARRGLNRAIVSLGGGGGRGGGPPGPGGGAGLATGEYMISVEVAGEKLTKPGRVRERIR
jgi:hypothetical protein